MRKKPLTAEHAEKGREERRARQAGFLRKLMLG
jgi:hypothetical protein